MSSPADSVVLRLETALRAVAQQARESATFREHFAQQHGKPFADLVVKLGVHARSQTTKEHQQRVRHVIDDAWASVYAGTDMLGKQPKLPGASGEDKQRPPPLTIFPGTSLADALKLAQANEHDRKNLQTALKYLDEELQRRLASLPSKTLKSYSEALHKLSAASASASTGGAPLAKELAERCGQRVVELAAHERAKAMQEERRRSKLEASDNPAAKRALAKIGPSTTSTPTPPPPAAAAAASKPQTDEEWEREYLKRARLANQRREEEEARSRKLGRQEDLDAEKDSSFV